MLRMNKSFYAHSLENQPPEKWQPLEEHLVNVAVMARGFASVFGAGEWGYLAGLWHDLGKYSREFQEYIVREGSRVDHATAGAQHAVSSLGGYGKLLAYALAGHHAGLPNGKDNNSSCLEERLRRTVPDFSAYPENLVFGQSKENPFFPFAPDRRRNGFQFSFFVRMLYSCLVDADFLDTEKFIDPGRAAQRQGYPSLAELWPVLDSHLLALQQKAKPSKVNRHRAAILRQCLDAAEDRRGLYSLTVPTGGGKTLSSLAFALRHALRHNLGRIIYVIPYTSIIEQNAIVFRRIFGDRAVLEHHCNYETPEDDRRSKLAAENWDAPIVVTTNVQFFESLFRTRSSRCRKIHNIANSVVILDEAQMLPVELLRPCLEVLRELAAAYRTSVVLCTATQPALREEDGFKQGLREVREVIANPQELYEALVRVRTSNLGRLTDAELVDRLAEHERVLCVVNTRRHARCLYEQLAAKGEEGGYHLSALMCPAHRSQALAYIREELANDRPCRVISTQLIEAGVDIDFPVVYRSVAGIDSIAQAAGRCNREGRPELGQVFIFEPEEGVGAGPARHAAQSAEPVLRRHADPLSLAAVHDYFQTHYWRREELLDKHGILVDLEEGASKGNYPFRDVDAKFRLIENEMEPVIIPWNDEAEALIAALRRAEYPGTLSRRLQRYTVQVPRFALAEFRVGGDVERLREQFNILINTSCYSEKIGLCSGKRAFIDAEKLVV